MKNRRFGLDGLSVSKSVRHIALAGLALAALPGCGGKGLVTNVTLTSSPRGAETWVEMKADLRQQGFTLPSVTLPLQDPKDASRVLGELVTTSGSIAVRVDASEVVKAPILDGSKLPSGAAIPISLDAGAVPVAIAVANSKSRVYFAANGKQILLGIALSILKEDRLNLPINIFFPFQMSAALSGTGGFFLGDTQGLAVFALAEFAPAGVAAPVSIASVGASSARVSSLALTSARILENTAPAPRIHVVEEPVTTSKLNRLQRVSRYYSGEVRID